MCCCSSFIAVKISYISFSTLHFQLYTQILKVYKYISYVRGIRIYFRWRKMIFRIHKLHFSILDYFIMPFFRRTCAYPLSLSLYVCFTRCFLRFYLSLTSDYSLLTIMRHQLNQTVIFLGNGFYFGPTVHGFNLALEWKTIMKSHHYVSPCIMAISIHQNYAIRASRDAFNAEGIWYVCNIIEMIWKLCVLWVCVQQGLDESDQMIWMRESQSYRANERPFVILNGISFRWFAGKSHFIDLLPARSFALSTCFSDN